MRIIIDRKDYQESKKLGFDTIYHIDSGFTMVEVEGDPMNFLREINAKKNSEKDQKKRRKLMDKRAIVADNEFSKYDFEKEGVEVEGCDGWVMDGKDRFIKKTYWTHIITPESNSSIGTFIVKFKKSSATVEDVHANL